MSNGIFFIGNVCNHQGTHLQQSATDTDTTFNIIHDFNCPRKHHRAIAAWRMWKKAIITLCDESKVKVRSPLGKWTLDKNKYMKNWQ